MKNIRMKIHGSKNLIFEVSSWPVEKSVEEEIVEILISFADRLSTLEIAKNFYNVKRIGKLTAEDTSQCLKKILTIESTGIKDLMRFYEKFLELPSDLRSEVELFLLDEKKADFTIQLLRIDKADTILKAIEAANDKLLVPNRTNGRRISKLFEEMSKADAKLIEVHSKFLIDELDNTTPNKRNATIVELLAIMNTITK